MSFSFNFFRPTPHKVFHYEPKYYDPKKEAMEERYAQLNEEKGKSKDGKYIPGKYIRTHMRNDVYKNKKDPGKVLTTRLIILISLVILFAIAFYLADGLGFILTSSK
ncbi:MAG: hypothetical protein ABFC18_00810 [Rikenellaceae bacterium]|jgi:hypothetical protein|nr:hypothetical protein [Bacteroidales bacterium]